LARKIELLCAWRKATCLLWGFSRFTSARLHG
jgi:hypothetical protein